MASTTELELLTSLAKRLEAERRRIVDLLAAAPAEDMLDRELLRQLSDVEGAWRAVAAETEAHTPTIGRGAES